jgi:hypothetical protein
MRTSIIIFILASLTFSGYCQTEKQFIFSQSDSVYHQALPASTIRFTPSVNEVFLADSLAEIHIMKNRSEYGGTRGITDYKSYFRQYVGYLNEKHDKIIFINSFCRSEGNWTKEIVSYRGGGSCYFNIKVNLDHKYTIAFSRNAPK